MDDALERDMTEVLTSFLARRYRRRARNRASRALAPAQLAP
jgi:predicted site-specific integrase-resolvase